MTDITAPGSFYISPQSDVVATQRSSASMDQGLILKTNLKSTRLDFVAMFTDQMSLSSGSCPSVTGSFGGLKLHSVSQKGRCSHENHKESWFYVSLRTF